MIPITDHMLGKKDMTNYLARKLNVTVGEVRKDGLVSLENTSCTGMCDQGPAGLVNGYSLTRLDRSRIDVITGLINRQKPLAEWPVELFQIGDNIHKPGLLLTQQIDQGAALRTGFTRGMQETLQGILDERRKAGLLGVNILKQGLDFDIEICLGADAYICGEESALIESLEGKAGIPRNRPPYPVTQGYLGKPTVVNNVETFYAASAIAVNGGEWFAGVGTEKSTGTKILSISGDCSRPGIYEYPFGTSIQAILKDCGANDVIGVQVGGPSGMFISDQEFDRKLAFEDLATGGSFIVFNNDRNILDIVNNFTRFFAHESCGFCTPCRVGTSLLKKQLDKIVEGHGSAGDVVALEELCQIIKKHSHCGLVLSQHCYVV